MRGRARGAEGGGGEGITPQRHCTSNHATQHASKAQHGAARRYLPASSSSNSEGVSEPDIEYSLSSSSPTSPFIFFSYRAMYFFAATMMRLW